MTENTNAEWLPITRKSDFGRIPYGYQISEGGDPASLVPDPELVPLIEQALDSLDNGFSLRETAVWLSETSGKKISHVGLSQIWKKRRGASAPQSAHAKKVQQIKAAQPTDREGKQQKKLSVKVASEKRRIKAAEKRIAKLEEKKGVEPAPKLVPPSSYMELEAVPEDLEEEIIFQPNPGPQTAFLAAPEKEVLFGGSAGGGKSYAMLADPMRYLDNPNFNGLLIRRTNDELRELKWKSQELYPRMYPKATFSSKDSEWRFPSGARLWMTYLERDEDVLRYQGQSFTWIGVDELTQYATPFAWNYLRSRLRTVDPNLPVFMRATSNPGGPGHQWVKKMFIDPAPYGKGFWATDIETGETLMEPKTFPQGHPQAGQPNPAAGKPLFRRRFIPASVFDNPYLRDSDYVQSLMSLPEDQRRQLLEGDWNVADGAAFPEFRAHIHTCEPFEIPYNWKRFRSCDYGYGSHSAVHWFAIDPVYETLYVYRELYTSKKTGEELADMILKLERDNGDRVMYGVLDSSCWHQRGMSGPTIAEAMINRGCRWRPSDRSAGSRVMGRIRLHDLLKTQPIGNDEHLPGIVFFDTCRQIIGDLPVIPSDPKGGDDIDDRFKSDHAYDSIRYGIMSRPSSRSITDPFNRESSWTPSDSTFGY